MTTQKIERLLSLLENLGKTGDLVLDAHIGSACDRLTLLWAKEERARRAAEEEACAREDDARERHYLTSKDHSYDI